MSTSGPSGPLVCYSHQRISKSDVWISLEQQLDLRGPIASQGLGDHTRISNETFSKL